MQVVNLSAFVCGNAIIYPFYRSQKPLTSLHSLVTNVEGERKKKTESNKITIKMYNEAALCTKNTANVSNDNECFQLENVEMKRHFKKVRQFNEQPHKCLGANNIYSDRDK